MAYGDPKTWRDPTETEEDVEEMEDMGRAWKEIGHIPNTAEEAEREQELIAKCREERRAKKRSTPSA